jgi:hypothetical protein
VESLLQETFVEVGRPSSFGSPRSSIISDYAVE